MIAVAGHVAETGKVLHPTDVKHPPERLARNADDHVLPGNEDQFAHSCFRLREMFQYLAAQHKLGDIGGRVEFVDAAPVVLYVQTGPRRFGAGNCETLFRKVTAANRQSALCQQAGDLSFTAPYLMGLGGAAYCDEIDDITEKSLNERARNKIPD